MLELWYELVALASWIMGGVMTAFSTGRAPVLIFEDVNFL
jgi:hypothetical protein